MSEQERLSRMVGDGFDPNAGSDMIAEALKSKLRVTPEKLDEIRREQRAAASTSMSKEDKYIREYLGHDVPSTKPVSAPVSIENVQVESLLLALYDVCDGLIDIYQRVGLNHEISDKLSNQIWNLEKCITKLGGEVKTFVPEDFVSGLEMPNNSENAAKVIATTKKCYKLGSVENTLIEDNGNTIRLTFRGNVNGIKYVANGEITAGEGGWSGSEAVDYVYRQGGGKMAVRSWEGNKWVNCKDGYKVKWELNEEFPAAEPKNSRPSVEETLPKEVPETKQEEETPEFPIKWDGPPEYNG